MKSKLDDDIDALFRLPLAEFTSARNTLAARLKKEGRANDAERVKLLSKPSISAWTVNQLYWEHRDEFDELMATGKRLRPLQTSRTAAKVAGMRDSLDARREVLSQLSDLAETLLQDAGHSPTPDTLRRITTTLEALSASSADGPTPGRLTQDLDPPSFEALASLMGANARTTEEPREPARMTPSRKSLSLAVPPTRQKTTAEDDRKIRQAKIAAAKMSLQDAKKALTEARTNAQSLEAAQKKANLEAKESEKQRREAEKQKREAEERWEKATAASEAAARHAEDVAAEADNAAQAVEETKRSVDEATKELESLLRDA